MVNVRTRSVSPSSSQWWKVDSPSVAVRAAATLTVAPSVTHAELVVPPASSPSPSLAISRAAGTLPVRVSRCSLGWATYV